VKGENLHFRDSVTHGRWHAPGFEGYEAVTTGLDGHLREGQPGLGCTRLIDMLENNSNECREAYMSAALRGHADQRIAINRTGRRFLLYAANRVRLALLERYRVAQGMPESAGLLSCR